MDLVKLCDRIIRSGFYLLFILVPLILTPFNYELFEYNKMMTTYALTAVIAGAWFVKMALKRRLAIARTPFDIPILAYLFSQFISALYSIDPHVSWFGYYSRFNGGLWSVLSYVFLFYSFVSNFTHPSAPEKETRTNKSWHAADVTQEDHENTERFLMRLIKVILFAGMIVSAYGILERMGIDKHLWVQDVQNRVFSTLGQPNWLAAYLTVLIPVSLAFVMKNSITTGAVRPFRAVAAGWGILTLGFFVTLLFTRSRSGLLGFAVSDALFFLMILLNKRIRVTAIKPAVVIHLVVLAVIFVNGTHIPQIDRYVTFQSLKERITTEKRPEAPQAQPSGTLLEYGGTESGTIRKLVWEAAVSAWRHSLKNRLIGTGTETYAWTFFRFRPVAHNLVSEWDFLYNKAHNEYLNYLATTGIIGLGSYLILLSGFGFYFVRTIMRSGRDKPPGFIHIGLFAGWISITVTNFFGFSVVIIQLLMFLLPAISYSLDLGQTGQGRFTSFRFNTLASRVFRVVTLLFTGYVLISLIVFWRADTLYATGYRYTRQGQYANAKTYLEQAVALNPGEPLYRDELAGTLAPLVTALIDEQAATVAAQLAQEAIRQNDLAISVSPENVNFWKTRTKIFYAFSEFNPEFNDAAISALTNARTLSPNDPRILYNLAILYGRKDDVKQAIALLTEAKKLKANYRDAYFGLYVFYTELKEPEKALAELTEYLTNVDPNDEEFKQRLEKP